MPIPSHLLSLAAIRQSVRWTGSAAELARLGAALLGEGPSGEVNERLVRDYVSRRVLRKPEREGRGATFDYDQLLQLIAARLLLKEEGWPLLKIAEFIGLAGRAELMRIIGRHAEPNDAIVVSRQLARESGFVAKPPMAPAQSSAGKATAPRRTFTQRAASTLGWREEFDRIRRSLGAATNEISTVEVTRIAIAPGFLVEIENARLRRMTDDNARTIGRAVEMALIETAVPRGGKK